MSLRFRTAQLRSTETRDSKERKRLARARAWLTIDRSAEMALPVEARADAGKPLPICIRNREWLVHRYQVDAMIALRFLGDDVPVRSEEKEEDARVVKHVRECPKCREWIHEIVPDSLFRRQSRLVRYCCAGMFTAVEEPRSVSVSFELFRGEDPSWKIDDKRAFISYCPWCGRKLPERPFIPEE